MKPSLGAAMFNFYRRFKYEGDVLVNVHSFFLFYPGELRKDFPGIKQAIRENWKAKTRPYSAAAYIAGAILSQLASRFPDEAKARILEELKSINYREFDKIVGEYNAPNADRGRIYERFAGKLLPATVNFATAFAVAELWRRLGELAEDEVYFIKSEAIGSLHGLSDGERSSARLGRAFDQILAET
jgi:hypothetical protein